MLKRFNAAGQPSAFITRAFEVYTDEEGNENVSRNGRVYELLLCEMLAQHGIVPFYHQAKFKFVPNVEFDIVLYDQLRPVALSAKTSLRERYKQADLEGIALKQVYRNAETHLLTTTDEATGVQNKIEEGIVSGLTSCVRTDSHEFDMLVKKLEERSFTLADEIMPVDGKLVKAEPA